METRGFPFCFIFLEKGVDMNYKKELSITIEKLMSARNTLTGMEIAMSEDPEVPNFDFSVIRCCNSMVNDVDDLLCQLHTELKARE